MEFQNWVIQHWNSLVENWNLVLLNWRNSGWGVTPLSLAAPVALLTVMLMARRFSRETGPNMEKRDVGGGVLIAVIIASAFLWIFAGLGLLGRTFR